MIRLVTFLLFVSSCQKAHRGRTYVELGDAPKDGDVVAVVGDAVLTVDDVRARFAARDAHYKETLKDPKALKEAIDDQIRFELLTQAAKKKGLDSDLEVQEAARKIMVQKLLREVLDSEVKASDISAADVEKFYKSHVADYRQPERARFSAIGVAGKAEADTLLAQLRKKPADAFKKAQADHGGTAIDETTFYTAFDIEEKFGAGAAPLMEIKELGSFGPVIQTPNGFLVAKLTGRKGALNRPADDVADVIRQRLYRERRAHAFDEYTERLRVALDVTVVDANVAKVVE